MTTSQGLSDSVDVEVHYIIQVTCCETNDTRCVRSPRCCCDHRTCTVPGTAAPCPPHPPAHLSLPRPNKRNLQRQPHTLRIRWHRVNSRSSHLKRPARAKAGRNPRPVSLPPRRAKTGLWWTFFLCLMTTSHWCVPLTFSGGLIYSNVVV